MKPKSNITILCYNEIIQGCQNRVEYEKEKIEHRLQALTSSDWGLVTPRREREREKCFYLTTHSTHFIYGYMASYIWLRTILIVRKEVRCRHIGYSYRLTARVLLYAPSHRQDNTYHGLCYTSRGALASPSRRLLYISLLISTSDLTLYS